MARPMPLEKRDWEAVDHRIRGIVNTAIVRAWMKDQERRRASDDKDEDYTGRRQSPLEPELDLGFKGYGLKARGELAILSLVILLVGGAGIYTLWSAKVEAQTSHNDIINGQELFGCIVSMDMETRKKVREFRDRQAFIGECPWLRIR